MKNRADNKGKRAVVCLECGRQLPEGARFCGYDGSKISQAETGTIDLPSITSLPKHCPICRRTFPAYAAFCPLDAARLLSRGVPTSDIDRGGRSGETRTAEAVQADLVSGLLGRIIDEKYEIESIIGEGGMAIVYLARHRQMERDVVIKIMHAFLLTRNNSVERFEREYKVTAKLNHPNIVSIYDVGTHGTREPYIVMEYVKGQTLADLIEDLGAMPLKMVALIASQICSGLEEAHSIGIIHRDLKPENILLHADSLRPDWVKIADFGIAHLVEGGKRLTHTGRLVGTPEYMSPEQLKDTPVDARSDIYALGVILFEMLTGRVPFTGDNSQSIMMKHLLEDPPQCSSLRPEITDDSAFAKMVQRCLDKQPDLRYKTVREMRLELEKMKF